MLFLKGQQKNTLSYFLDKFEFPMMWRSKAISIYCMRRRPMDGEFRSDEEEGIFVILSYRVVQLGIF